MSRRNRKRLQKMHAVPLINKALDGDPDAITEVIDRQQENKALRYYPSGRSSVDDNGVVLVSVRPRDGGVEIRSGRPWGQVSITKEIAFDWIMGIPRCLSSTGGQYSAQGTSAE